MQIYYPNVVLTAEAFPDAIPIFVTGITSNGFFRVDLGETYYVAGYGLQVDIPDANATTSSVNDKKDNNTVEENNKKQNTVKDTQTKTVTKNVWLSATGDKYHSKNNCGRMNPQKARKVTEQEAVNLGYGKCKKCW